MPMKFGWIFSLLKNTGKKKLFSTGEDTWKKERKKERKPLFVASPVGASWPTYTISPSTYLDSYYLHFTDEETEIQGV